VGGPIASYGTIAAGAVALSVYALAPAARTALYVLVGLAATAAVAMGMRSQGVGLRSSWGAVLVGLAGLVTADIVWTAIELAGKEVGFPSIPDVLYLLSYPVLALGLVLVARVRGATRSTLLDTAAIAFAMTAILYLAVVRPVVETGSTPLETAVALAYPIGSVVLLAAALSVVLAGGERTMAVALLAVGLGAQLVADAAYAHSSLAGTYVEGALVDYGWLTCYVLIAAAALHPSMAQLVDTRRARVSGPATPRLQRLTTPRLVLLAGAALAIPLTDAAVDLSPDWAVSSATAFVVAVVMSRCFAHVRSVARSAEHDDLTGLANRSYLGMRLQAALDSATGAHKVALLVCDLDDFKVVNDGLGHLAGDELLRILADRMQACVRSQDVVARLGGDEFVVLLTHVDDDTIAAIGQRLLAAVRRPVHLGGPREIVSSVSVGVAVTVAGASAEDLLRDADAALYLAKERGRGRMEYFDEELRSRVVDRLELEGDLRRALKAGELFCVHQPEIDLLTGQIFGLESLARWRHPTRGVVSPDQFIPIAEASGLIGEVFATVLRHTLAAQQEWAARLGFAPAVAVNISARQLGDAHLVELVMSELRHAGADPSTLWLEVTETAAADAVDLSVLHRLQAQGVRFAVDDFGTGWSSLSRLSLFSWDLLKIDQGFIARLDTDRDAEHVVRAMVAMAHALGMRTVAEGVETQQQLGLLRSMGCDIAQGFLFAEPSDPLTAIARVQSDGRWDGPPRLAAATAASSHDEVVS
jgi:diguanylate cyclase